MLKNMMEIVTAIKNRPRHGESSKMSMSVLTPNGGLELFPTETHSCSHNILCL